MEKQKRIETFSKLRKIFKLVFKPPILYTSENFSQTMNLGETDQKLFILSCVHT